MNNDFKRAAEIATNLKLETTREFATRLLKDGAFAMAQKKSNPALYEAARRDQVRLKLRDDNQHDVLKATRAGWDTAKTNATILSARQIEAQVAYPIEKVRGMGADEVVKLKRNDPAKYQLYRLSAATFGYLSPDLVPQLNVPDDPTDAVQTLHEIPTAIVEKLNIDPSVRVTTAGLNKALEAYGNKVAAERIAEMEAAKNAAAAQSAAQPTP